MTSIGAALAYYAFLAVPAALLIAVGLFGLFAGPGAVSTTIGKLHSIVPADASRLIEGSLTRTTRHRGTGLAVLLVGSALALWSLTGAMQNVMWAVNIAYEREDGRSFVRKRVIALGMVVFAFVAFALAFGVLVLGPHISTWLGDALGQRSGVKIAWYVAEWPLLIGGLLFAFAGLMYLAPNVEQRRWRFVTLGGVLAIALWLLASGAFAFYASRFGSYDKTWGSLAAVVVMLTWFWLGALALLYGAEVDAETERSRGVLTDSRGT